ncbi:hypothetical protein GQ53DRAFT_752272 [Thozetella sp. PMI_491]|nr:hypothetical protein GQ53DRAFT_752272 [Thozetella sp. PMI_491]
MRRWFKTVGKDFRNPTPGKTNYLSGYSDQPFPLNPAFKSHPVLSESSRTQIWNDIIVRGEGLKEVSVKYGIDIRRVAAVVRLKEIEKKWAKEGKQFARPYSRAVLSMLPCTELDEGHGRLTPHESTGEVHVHSHTMQQLFVPTPESRSFTREHAARAFGDRIVPVDKALQIPELIEYERELSRNVNPDEAHENFRKAVRDSETRIAESETKKLREAQESKVRVANDRFEFRFTAYNAENIGPGGRSKDAVGWRYGVPHSDRKKGQIKIPPRVGPKDLSGLV